MSPRKKIARKPLPGFGVKGALGKRGAYVRAFLELGLVRIQWTEQGRRKTESWPDTASNRAIASAFAHGVAERLGKPLTAGPRLNVALSVRDLWDAYRDAEFDHMRPRSQDAMRKRWAKFDHVVGPDRLAQSITRETLDQFRAELRRIGHVPEQIARHVQVVKQVYEWAVDRDLIPPTKVTTYKYKRGRDEKALVIPEYSPKEASALLGGLDPRDSKEWRLYVALFVFAFAGPRQHAARHLEWRDVDFAAGTVRWRPELDKLGYDRTQLLPAPVLDALWVAYGWRTAYGYDGPFILFRPGAGSIDRGGWHTVRKAATKRSLARSIAKADKPWTYQAFNQALARLERACKVKHVPYRAAHGFRRYVVTEVLARTGNLVLAGQYVGDKDVRTLMRSYVRERPEEMRGVVGHMEQAAAVHESDAIRNADATRALSGAHDTELTND